MRICSKLFALQFGFQSFGPMSFRLIMLQQQNDDRISKTNKEHASATSVTNLVRIRASAAAFFLTSIARNCSARNRSRRSSSAVRARYKSAHMKSATIRAQKRWTTNTYFYSKRFRSVGQFGTRRRCRQSTSSRRRNCRC